MPWTQNRQLTEFVNPARARSRSSPPTKPPGPPDRQRALRWALNPRTAESSAGRAVSQVHDARAERARLEQFHVDTVISREERDAAADRDRIDEQPVLVDQIQTGRLGSELGASYRYVSTHRLLERGQLCAQVIAREGRVRSVDRVQRPREHHLRQRPPGER